MFYEKRFLRTSKMSGEFQLNGEQANLYSKIENTLCLLCIAFECNCLFILESGTEAPMRTLVTSLLFQCNLFKVISNDATNATAQCLVCKRNGQGRYVKGKTTSNYHLHMKVCNANEMYIRTISFTSFICNSECIKENMTNI